METTVILTASFLQNVNYGNKNSVLQHVSLKIVSEPFTWGEKNDTRRSIYNKNNKFLSET